MTENDRILAELAIGETIETIAHSLGLAQEEAQYMLDLAEELKREREYHVTRNHE